ncbi:hypothetical protein ACHQM5_019239 [Ranunculus cassubicifolius]
MLRFSSTHFPSIRTSLPFPLISSLIPSNNKFISSNSFLKPISISTSIPYLNLSSSSMPPKSTSTKASFSSSNSTGGDREILVQHLLVNEDNLNLLVELHKKIAQGEDLSDLAAEYSICPSKEQGGMLGWVQAGQMVPEFEEAAFNAPLNKVVRCKTKFGWHLLEVLSEREAALLQNIEPEELHMKLKDPNFLEEVQLIDVREPDEVAQASLPGFEVLPLSQFALWSFDVPNRFNPEKETYCLCHHGVRSLQFAKWLQTQEFKRIYNVTGGIHAYATKVDPSVPTY